MPSRKVNLTPDLDDFVATRVESGRYENASELVQAALRALDREERIRAANQAVFRVDGDQSRIKGLAEGDVFRKLWQAEAQRPRTHLR
jgi:antitoxin ParD1/3/4